MLKDRTCFSIFSYKKITLSLILALVLICSPLGAAAQDGADIRADILNSVELDPHRPGSENLNAYLEEELMPSLIDDEMDTYEQVAACYDYIRDNVRYGSHIANLNAKMGNTTCREISRKYGVVEGYGAVALSARVGMCNAYASAFIVMARRIGLDAYLVKGQTKDGGGGYAYHEWAEVEIDGEKYIFDPQLDQSLMRAGLTEHMVFCVTYDQVPGRYIKY